MSEAPKQENKKQTAYRMTRAGLALVGGLTLVNHAAENIVGPEPVKTTDAKITHNVSMNKPVSVLEGGKAVIDLGKGKRAIVTNPLVEKGTVAERTTGDNADKDLVTAYDPSSDVAGSAKDVTYVQGGHELTSEEAVAAATSERVNVDPSTGALVVSEGQANAGETVGQSVHQHKETRTQEVFVNNK